MTQIRTWFVNIGNSFMNFFFNHKGIIFAAILPLVLQLIFVPKFIAFFLGGFVAYQMAIKKDGKSKTMEWLLVIISLILTFSFLVIDSLRFFNHEWNIFSGISTNSYVVKQRPDNSVNIHIHASGTTTEKRVCDTKIVSITTNSKGELIATCSGKGCWGVPIEISASCFKGKGFCHDPDPQCLK